MTAGDRVVIRAGDRAGEQGTVADTFREPGCRCRSVIVRLDSGREWAGKASEVRRLAAGGTITPGARYEVGHGEVRAL